MKSKMIVGLLIGTALGAGCKASLTTQPAPAPGGTGAAAAPAHKHGDPAPEWWKSSVTVTNDSDWTFTQLFMSPASASQWGADQLRDAVIKKGEAFKLTGIDCDNWDLKIIDHDGDECIVKNVDLCVQDAEWTLTNDDLLACQVLTKDKGSAN